MPCLPVVDQHFRILRFIAQRASQAAVVFVRMSQDNAANIGNAKVLTSESLAQSFNGFLRFGPGIDQG